MTEAQRVGQLFLMGLTDDKLGSAEIAGIEAHHLGSVSFTATTSEGATAVRQVTDQVQAQATKANTDGIGFFVAANQEGGEIQALRGPGFSVMPTAVEQGQMPPSALEAEAQTWGRELAAARVNLNFAPVMDVVPAGTEAENQPIGALQREYGSDPETVGAHGVAFLQGMEQAGVATTAKHFPGLGRVEGNTDFTADVVDTVTTANDPFLDSFQAAVVAGVPLVMVALATYTKIDAEHLAVFSPIVMHLLRDTEGFEGVIASDDLGGAAAIVDIPPATRAIDFLEAGGDLVVVKGAKAAGEMAQAVVERAASDHGFAELVGDATMLVLQAKDASGLLPC
jgi:beta-N-acetylhexosaminidase